MPPRLPAIASLILLLPLLCCMAPATNRSATQLDELFIRLRLASSGEEAQSIETAILHLWAVSGRQEVDLLVLRGNAMARTGDLDGALEVFDQVVNLAPDFAEGYHLRALVHTMRNEYTEALVDLRQVLLIEPRHFGALTGIGRILLLYDREQAALRAFDEALELDPYLDAVRDQAERLRDHLTGEPI